MYTVAGQSLSTGTYRTPPSNPLLPRLSGQKYGGYCPSLFLLTLNVFLICGKAYTETYQESKLERVAKIVFEPSIVLVERQIFDAVLNTSQGGLVYIGVICIFQKYCM